MKQITFKQYRAIDLTILCVMTAIFEAITTVATSNWFVLQAMAISITLAMTCIALLRWGLFAVLPSLVGSLTFCIASGATPDQYVVYCVGAIFALIAYPIALMLDKEKIRLSFSRRLIFAVSVYLFTVLGRWLTSLLFVPTLETLKTFLTTDVLSLLFAILILYVCKGLDGVIEDQRHYLIRLDEERKAEQEQNLNDPF